MVKDSAKSPPAASRNILRLSLFLFLLFFVNLLMGKCNIVYKWSLPHLDGVAEFLLLGVASTTLIWAALKREGTENERNNQRAKEA